MTDLPATRAVLVRWTALGNIFLVAIVSSQTAWCAPPLASDDAAVLGPGECQLETEQRQFRHRKEWDLASACNLFWDTETGIGRTRVAPDAGPRADSVVYQFKKILATPTEGQWSFGIAAATVRALGEQSGTRQNVVNALITKQIGDTALHLNVGAVRDFEAAPDTRKNRFAWALAVEHNATERWTIVGEAFGQRGMPTTTQAGIRWWALPKHVQLTSSLGAQRGEGRDGRWVSLG
ncbi:MAG: hypothetical protein ABL931_03090, partial [Usitatibacteraceae bacterium]